MFRKIVLPILPLLFALGCEPLAEPRDVSGNFELTYEDRLRVYLNDTLIADVAPGDDPSITYDGQTFQLAAVCGDDGTQCPSETFWGQMGVEQPLGSGNKLLNFVNLDAEHGTRGDRIAGTMQDDGSFAMLAGLGLDGNEACAVLGVATVVGRFAGGGTPDIEEATLVYAWDAGCQIAGTTLTGSLRIETDVVGVRTGALDLTTVESAPIDADGAPIGDGGDDASRAPASRLPLEVRMLVGLVLLGCSDPAQEARIQELEQQLEARTQELEERTQELVTLRREYAGEEEERERRRQALRERLAERRKERSEGADGGVWKDPDEPDEPPPPPVTVETVREALSDIEEVARLGRALLHRGSDGEFDGYRLSAIRRGSLGDRVGLRNGDIVHEVNGLPLHSMASAMEAYNQLQDVDELVLKITRRGMPETVTIPMAEPAGSTD